MKEKIYSLFEKTSVQIFCIVLFGFLAYSNTFNSPFTFDDHVVILKNPIIKNFDFFKTPFKYVDFNLPEDVKISIRTRYLGFLTLNLNYKLGGFDVFGYHLFNIVLHLINSVVLFLLLRLTFKTPYLSKIDDSELKRYAPFFIAIFFTVHPLQTQVVTYIWQRVVSIATFFYLLSLLFYVKWRFANKGFSMGFYVLSLICAVLAMFSKEIAITLPVIILLYEFTLLSGNIKKRLAFTIPHLLTIFIIPVTAYFAKRLYVADSSITAIVKNYNKVMEISKLDYLFTQFRVIMTYLRLLILPINQNLDYDYPIYHSLFSVPVFLSFLFILFCIATALYLYYKSWKESSFKRLLAFGIVWFFITLSVESSFIPLDDVIFEHRVYLPSVGFFIFAVTFLLGLKKRVKLSVILATLSLLSFALLVATYNRNLVWHDEKTLWHDIASKSPNKARVWANLANAYRDNPKMQKVYIARALSLKPFYPVYYINYAKASFASGDFDEGMKSLYRVISFGYRENLVKEILDIGNNFLNNKSYELAIRCYELVLSTPYYKDEAQKNIAIAREGMRR
ncbi:MAG: hypothetical protein OHK0040_06020 [bacterium]